MAKVLTVRGRVSDPTHIELDQPIDGSLRQVEVVLRPLPANAAADSGFSLLGLCADLGSAPSSAEIDDARREMLASFAGEDF